MCGDIREISYENLYKLIKSEVNLVLVDTRSPQEFDENRINGAINIPDYEILRRANNMLPNKDMLIILYSTCIYSN